MKPEGSKEWLERALLDLCRQMKTGLVLDVELISGLVSYCDMATPQDAQEYLTNIIGEETGQYVIKEYLKRRGFDTYQATDTRNQELHVYQKPPKDTDFISLSRKQMKSLGQEKKGKAITSDTKIVDKNHSTTSRKKKSGKVVSLEEAAKGSIVFQQGKPCSCQARRHRLVSNCLSCGKIVCEQEGEGPCSFCGALVLREGSNYAGLNGTKLAPSDAEVAAEAFTKRLVEYDRSAAARTTVIDDQSDYYEIDGNSWLSTEEKEVLKKKQEEIEEAERARRSKVRVTFDLVGRKVMLAENDAQGNEPDSTVPTLQVERETNRIMPNPTIKFQPVFIDQGQKRTVNENLRWSNGLCLEISGRVQHDADDLVSLQTDGFQESTDDHHWQEYTGECNDI